jgi:hypothetical protein
MNKMERALMMWERKVLRRIYGPTYGSGSWRIKINQEICKSPDIVTVIEVYRLEWFGRVVRITVKGQ